MSLKHKLFESEVKKLGLPTDMETVIDGIHDVAFHEDENDAPEFVEKDWKSVDKDLGEGNSSVATI